MRSPLSQSLQNSTPSLTQGRTIPYAVGEAPHAGDALASVRGAQHLAVAGLDSAVKYKREYRQRMEMDRRKLSRRIHSACPLQIELRTGFERRGGSRRGGEPAMHIRVNV
ncbi:MAG: hypothetical protein KJ850_08635 [Gammaproteobacteria bacterium]|nr:hypothetical protein [Gammaproteobacteria bacterium]MBU1625107.1 hypothetical protein [Gammaproteobacteria bacterium]MBU1981367.1 hypothetical protein [Gammaproteobacteria bacterium]